MTGTCFATTHFLHNVSSKKNHNPVTQRSEKKKESNRGARKISNEEVVASFEKGKLLTEL